VDWIIKTDIGEFNGDLSPDGHWLAYQANNSGQFGQFQVYVQPFPDASAGRWQVSTDGGTKPMWARNGRELFFLDRNNLLTAVAIQTSGARFNAGKPIPVLNTPYYAGGSERGRTFDVSADGQRFLMVKDDPAGRQPASMVVVFNWVEDLRRLIPAGR
jgi:serine/threonine-protein kinase